MTLAPLYEVTRNALTSAQWRALDYIYKQELINGRNHQTLWRLLWRTPIMRAMEDHGVIELTENARARMTPKGRKLVKIGPPENVIMMPGHYTWLS